MAKAAGVVALVLGGMGALVGFVLYNTCTTGISIGGNLMSCFAYGYQDVGLLGMVFGGALFVVGIVLLAIPEKKPMAPMVYYPPPDAYGPPPQPVYPAPAPAQAHPTPSGQKFCPVCGSRYPADYKVCPRDSTELKSVS